MLRVQRCNILHGELIFKYNRKWQTTQRTENKTENRKSMVSVQLHGNNTEEKCDDLFHNSAVVLCKHADLFWEWHKPKVLTVQVPILIKECVLRTENTDFFKLLAEVFVNCDYLFWSLFQCVTSLIFNTANWFSCMLYIN